MARTDLAQIVQPTSNHLKSWGRRPKKPDAVTNVKRPVRRAGLNVARRPQLQPRPASLCVLLLQTFVFTQGAHFASGLLCLLRRARNAITRRVGNNIALGNGVAGARSVRKRQKPWERRWESWRRDAGGGGADLQGDPGAQPPNCGVRWWGQNQRETRGPPPTTGSGGGRSNGTSSPNCRGKACVQRWGVGRGAWARSCSRAGADAKGPRARPPEDEPRSIYCRQTAPRLWV